MSTAWRLAVADIRGRVGLAIGAALLIAVPITGYLLLDGFATGIERDFVAQPTTDLIVQEANSVGEVAGSRIDSSFEQALLDMGVTFAIPEIHAVAGSNADNAVLIRGIDSMRYRSITSFELVDGRALEPTDSATDVMVGVDLAESRAIEAGDPIVLRGRPFDVVGVFEIGTYTDNEVWLSLEGARGLVGWEDEVSIFVIPDDGALAEGQVLPGPLSVARRGDVVELAGEWDPIISLASFATMALAAASAFVLAVVLWRMAWLRRHDLAVLRSVGMGRSVPTAYLAALGLVVAAAGFVAGLVGALVSARFIAIDSFGIISRAVFEAASIVRGTTMTAAILAFAVGFSAARLLKARPADLLRSD